MKINRRVAAQSMMAVTAGGMLGLPRARAARGPVPRAIKTQICVVGGGSGGIGAALAAARAGANVVLVEQESILGGTSTNAWVHTWEPVSGADGIPRELYEAMRSEPLAVTEFDYDRGAPRRGGQSLPFEPRSWRTGPGRYRMVAGGTE